MNEAVNQFLEGRYLTAQWNHTFSADSALQVLAYADEEGRYENGGGPAFGLNSYDIEVQHNFRLADWNSVVWGAGERYTDYTFENTALQLIPARQGLNLANLFAQDTASLSPAVKLVLGLKLESEPYANVEPMPSIRLSWKLAEDAIVWAAVSRAVRSPTPVDENLREFFGPIDVLNGSSYFRPEVMSAYEAGTRLQLSPRASLSVSGYYDVYDNLRTLNPGAPPTYEPIFFGNELRGHSYGVEAWADYHVTDWWRLSAGANLHREDFRYKSPLDTLGGISFVADDPNHQASLRSSVDIGSSVTWDADFRYVGRLPHPVVPAYTELNMRVGWKITEKLDLSVAGFNLLHPQHQEFIEPGETDQIPRSYFIQTRWRF